MYLCVPVCTCVYLCVIYGYIYGYMYMYTYIHVTSLVATGLHRAEIPFCHRRLLSNNEAWMKTTRSKTSSFAKTRHKQELIDLL